MAWDRIHIILSESLGNVHHCADCEVDECIYEESFASSPDWIKARRVLRM